MLTLIIVMTSLLLTLGIGYPLIAILLFPIYSWYTGDKDFRKYLSEL